MIAGGRTQTILEAVIRVDFVQTPRRQRKLYAPIGRRTVLYAYIISSTAGIHRIRHLQHIRKFQRIVAPRLVRVVSCQYDHIQYRWFGSKPSRVGMAAGDHTQPLAHIKPSLFAGELNSFLGGYLFVAFAPPQFDEAAEGNLQVDAVQVQVELVLVAAHHQFELLLL